MNTIRILEEIMKRKKQTSVDLTVTLLFAVGILTFPTILPAQELNVSSLIQEQTGMKITKNNPQTAQQGPEEYFTGRVTIHPRFASEEEGSYSGGLVSFDLGARTAWHTHPKGQTLIVISGEGRAQVHGGEIQKLEPGDVVWFPAGEKHWHGAAPDKAMSHIAIVEPEDGVSADWMEHVTDEQYNKL